MLVGPPGGLFSWFRVRERPRRTRPSDRLHPRDGYRRHRFGAEAGADGRGLRRSHRGLRQCLRASDSRRGSRPRHQWNGQGTHSGFVGHARSHPVRGHRSPASFHRLLTRRASLASAVRRSSIFRWMKAPRRRARQLIRCVGHSGLQEIARRCGERCQTAGHAQFEVRCVRYIASRHAHHITLVVCACVHPLRNLGRDVTRLGRFVVFRNLV